MRAAVGDIPPQDLAIRGIYPWVSPDHTLGDYLAANSSEHYAQHRDDLERWLLGRQSP